MKKINTYSYLFFLLITLFAIYFAVARVLYSDSAFQFFKIIQNEGFNFEASRYAVFPTQLLTIFAIQLNLNLESLVTIFSISFVLLYFLIFLMITIVFKQNYLGLALILTFILPISHSFFHTVTETHQAIAWAMLFHAFILSEVHKKMPRMISFLLSILIITFAFFTHPVSFFMIAFSIGYYTIESGKLINIRALLLLMFVFILSLAKVFLTPANSYEGNLFTPLFNIHGIVRNIGHNNCFTVFVRNIPAIYLILLLITAWTFVEMYKQKKFLLFAWSILFFVFYNLIILISFHGGDAQIMMEKVYMVMFFFTLIPFCQFIVLPRFDSQRKIRLFIMFIVIVSFVRIAWVGKFYNGRIKYMAEIIEKHRAVNEQKVVYDNTILDAKQIKTWAYGVETLIYSSFGNKPSVSIYINIDDPIVNKNINDSDLFLCVHFWPIWKESELNKRYFKLNGSPYKLVVLSTK